jgi:CubicO group peptidase (beta-lactamase class C family)
VGELRKDQVDQLRTAVEGEVEKAGLASCQYALALDGEVIVSETVGDAAADARYLMFSATKILPAAVIWQLIGEGKLDPAAPVADVWPGFAGGGKASVTLAQVMSHTGGFPSAPLSSEAGFDRAKRSAEIETWTLEWEPGTRYMYHPISAHWVLAELIAQITGKDHCVAIRERLLDPLGLDRLELGVPADRIADILPIVPCGEPPTEDELKQELGPEAAAMFIAFFAAFREAAAAAPPPAPAADAPAVPEVSDILLRPDVLAVGVPAGGGVSDAASLALLYQAFLHDPKGLWDPAVLADATSTILNTLPDPLGVAAMRGLGVEIAGDDGGNRFRIGSGATSPAAFGHRGANGQIAWADPATGLSFAFLTNAADRNSVRQGRRDRIVNAAAAACIA